MDVGNLFKQGERFVSENSPSLLTAVGVAGTVTTAVLTGRASYKAAEIIRKEEDLHEVELETKEKLEVTWPLFIPPVGVGSVTVVSIIMANRIGSKRVAAIAAAYSISEKAFTDYKEKVVEKLGENKERSVRDELAQDRVNKNPNTQVLVAGAGEVLFYDAVTGRYFMSSMEKVKKAQNTINYDIINNMYASLSAFYEEIGLPPTSYSDEVGWNANNLLELSFSTTMSNEDKPCIVIDFVVGPRQDYAQLY